MLNLWKLMDFQSDFLYVGELNHLHLIATGINPFTLFIMVLWPKSLFLALEVIIVTYQWFQFEKDYSNEIFLTIDSLQLAIDNGIQTYYDTSSVSQSANDKVMHKTWNLHIQTHGNIILTFCEKRIMTMTMKNLHCMSD